MKLEQIVLTLAISLLFSFGIGTNYIANAQEEEESEREPIEIISEIRSLMNQTLLEYQNQNYTGASSLAEEAYLENFEFIEGPLEQQDETLMEETEVMLREKFRDLVKAGDKVAEVQQLIDKINSNLDKAETLLANQSSD